MKAMLWKIWLYYTGSTVVAMCTSQEMTHMECLRRERQCLRLYRKGLPSLRFLCTTKHSIPWMHYKTFYVNSELHTFIFMTVICMYECMYILMIRLSFFFFLQFFGLVVCGYMLWYDEVVSDTGWRIARVSAILRSISDYSCQLWSWNQVSRRLNTPFFFLVYVVIILMDAICLWLKSIGRL